jgi:hypothetical protein
MGLSYTCSAHICVVAPETGNLKRRLKDCVWAVLQEMDDSLKKNALKIKQFQPDEQGRYVFSLECGKIHLDIDGEEDGDELLEKFGKKIVQTLGNLPVMEKRLNIDGYQNERDPDIDYWYDSEYDSTVMKINNHE